MRNRLLAGFAASLLAVPALAQPAPTSSQPPPAQTVVTQGSPPPTAPKVANPAAAAMPAVTPPTGTMPADGLAGANSFTEVQARSRLEKDGFSNISTLAKDKDGIWRGSASKASKEQAVGVDYKGNIVSN